MKTIVLMFDSLNRHMLPPYGCDWVHAPNFQKLATRSITFDKSYVCSMPCMPARRDYHTGRPNFLHRSWGPLEPYDQSVFETLKENGVYTHLVTDHYHYFEEGGGNYHTKYNTWEFFRGQEGDPWQGLVGEPSNKPIERLGQHAKDDRWRDQDWKNRKALQKKEDHCMSRTFAAGMDFLRQNKEEDKWILQIECFDPHEPYFSPEDYKKLYAAHFDNYKGPHHDWPNYGPDRETREQLEHLNFENAALVSMCDRKLGELLAFMDSENMWDDTMLVVWTDHGFLLGEHDGIGKNWCPMYEEISHTPFFVWDPRFRKANERRKALVQPSIDLAPTLLGFYGIEPNREILGKDLSPAIESDSAVRDAALFGMFGAHVNVTDGRYVYIKAPNASNQPINQYTLMPARMSQAFRVEELSGPPDTCDGFGFTRGCGLMKIPGRPDFWESGAGSSQDLLFDLLADPKQASPIENRQIETEMREILVELMRQCEAPEEQFARLGLEALEPQVRQR